MKNQNATILVSVFVFLALACGGTRSAIRMPEREMSVRSQGTPQSDDSYAADDSELVKAKADLEEVQRQLENLKEAQKNNSQDKTAEISRLEAEVQAANAKVVIAQADNKKAMDKLKTDLLGFSIQYKHSGKCLGVENDSNVDGARLRQQSCNSSSAQKFRLVERASGQWVQNLASGKCLAAQANGTGNGTQVVQATCVDNGAMLNNLQNDGSGFYFIRNAGSNRCVDIEAISMSDGAGAQIYDCLNGDAQRVKLISSSD